MGYGMTPEKIHRGIAARQLEFSHSGKKQSDKEPVFAPIYYGRVQNTAVGVFCGALITR